MHLLITLILVFIADQTQCYMYQSLVNRVFPRSGYEAVPPPSIQQMSPPRPRGYNRFQRIPLQSDYGDIVERYEDDNEEQKSE